jgi:hypothetical protein
MKRKIIQIAAAGEIQCCSLFALCDDGAVCWYDFEETCWYEAESIECCKKLKTQHFEGGAVIKTYDD